MRRGLLLAIVGAAVLLGGAGLALAYEAGLLRLSYPQLADYPVRGIDVSHHQGPIDWAAVARSGEVKFAYVKASEGGDHRDRTFARNARAAHAHGLPIGAYHFFTLCRPGAEQARNFLAATRGANLRLAPAIDLEFGGNCGSRPTREAFERELSAFIAELELPKGQAPVLYLTEDFHNAYIRWGPFERHPIWYRDLVGGLDAPPRTRVVLWQYGARGRVRGISGPVDLNAFVGGPVAFRAASS